MTADDFLGALQLPVAALVHQRVPKKALLDHGKLSAGDKRLLGAAVVELWWEASLKPANVAIPAYDDGEVHCEEIQVFQIVLRDPTKSERVAHLLHRTIPYPLLVFSCGNVDMVSMARKRASLAQVERVVVLEHLYAPVPAALAGVFCEHLALAGLSHFHLQATYEGWLARVVALQGAAVNGRFVVAGSAEALAAQRAEMDRVAAVRARIRALLAEAKGERNVRRLAEINLEVKRLEESLTV